MSKLYSLVFSFQKDCLTYIGPILRHYSSREISTVSPEPLSVSLYYHETTTTKQTEILYVII